MTCPYRLSDPTDLEAVFTDPATSAVHALEPMTPLGPTAAAIYAAVMASEAGKQAGRSLLATDDTATDDRPAGYHTRLAAPVRDALGWFTARPSFRGDLARTAADFAGSLMLRRQPVDLAAVAWWVPLSTMAVDGFGFDPAVLPDVHAWSRAQTDLIWRRGIDEAGQIAGLGAARDLSAACAAVVDTHQAAIRRGAPDDITTRLLRAGQGEDRLTREEVIGLVYGLTIASHEATSHAITLTVRHLLAAGQWAAASSSSAAAGRLVADALRADPPIHTIHRTATADIPVPSAGAIPAGTAIEGDLRAACKAGGMAWAFGVPGSPHFCLGARLGRLEVAAVVRALAAAWPGARLVDPDDGARVDSWFFAGPPKLPLDLQGKLLDLGA